MPMKENLFLKTTGIAFWNIYDINRAISIWLVRLLNIFVEQLNYNVYKYLPENSLTRFVANFILHLLERRFAVSVREGASCTKHAIVCMRYSRNSNQISDVIIALARQLQNIIFSKGRALFKKTKQRSIFA